MTISHDSDDVPASYGVDLKTEESVSGSYDIDALAARLTTSIERRGFGRGAVIGLLAGVIASGTSVLAFAEDATDPSPTPAPVAQVAPAEDPPASCPACTCSGVGVIPPSVPSSLSASASPRQPRVSTPVTTPATEIPAADEMPAVDELSRLRQELVIFEIAKAAFDRGANEAAIDTARVLRERFPDAPMAVEAGLIEGRALLRESRFEELTLLVAALRADPSSTSKELELADLESALTRALPADAAPPEPARQIIGVPTEAP